MAIYEASALLSQILRFHLLPPHPSCCSGQMSNHQIDFCRSLIHTPPFELSANLEFSLEVMSSQSVEAFNKRGCLPGVGTSGQVDRLFCSSSGSSTLTCLVGFSCIVSRIELSMSSQGPLLASWQVSPASTLPPAVLSKSQSSPSGPIAHYDLTSSCGPLPCSDFLDILYHLY